jgi:hypothetical protein
MAIFLHVGGELDPRYSRDTRIAGGTLMQLLRASASNASSMRLVVAALRCNAGSGKMVR